MPRISFFLGISIYMYPYDHGHPHIHAQYGEFQMKFRVEPFELIRGTGPARVQNLVEEWASQHLEEIMSNWRLCQDGYSPMPINPLD